MARLNFNVGRDTHRLFVMVCSLYGQSQQVRLTELVEKDIKVNRGKVSKFILGKVERKSKRVKEQKRVNQKKVENEKNN